MAGVASFRFAAGKALRTVLFVATFVAGLSLSSSGQSKLLAKVGTLFGKPEMRPPVRLHVIDEKDQPVAECQAKLMLGRMGSSMWESAKDGTVSIRTGPTEEVESCQAIVRAPGFASSLIDISRDEMRKGEAILVKLQRGQEVQIEFELPATLKWHEKISPVLFFETHRRESLSNWDLRTQQTYARLKAVLDLNSLNFTNKAPGQISLRLTEQSPAFCVSIHQPGFLEAFCAGPFRLKDFKKSVLNIPLPNPATLSLEFDRSAATDGKLPFDHMTFELMAPLGVGSSQIGIEYFGLISESARFKVDGLAPGKYSVMVRGYQEPGLMGMLSGEPQRYFDQQKFTLKPGEAQSVAMKFHALDRKSYRGDRTAKIHLANADGSPAKELNVELAYAFPGYGHLKVFSGKTSNTGDLEVPGLTDRDATRETAPELGAFRVDVDGHRVGWLRFAPGKQTEEFRFQLAPRVGDMVPNIELVRVGSGAKSKLHDFKGKVVCLELWASWCGPCQPPMSKLNGLAADKKDTWRDRAVIVPVSIDDEITDAARHVQSRGWNGLEHYWTGEGENVGFQSPAAKALVLEGVPSMVIIDRDSKIAWIGNPWQWKDPASLAKRIESLLK